MERFCEVCGKTVEASIRVVEGRKTIRGKEIVYEKKEAHCDQCGQPVFITELRDENLDRLEAAFEGAEG